EIAHTVLALSVWLIVRLVVDVRTGGDRSFEVLVDIVHMPYQSGACDADFEWRADTVLGSDAMQPDRSRSCANFSMNRLTFVVAVDASGFKPECFHEESRVPRRDRRRQEGG